LYPRAKTPTLIESKPKSVLTLRICVISQYFPPDTGGASTRASNVVNGLIEGGKQVTVITAFPHYPSGNIPTRYRGKLLSVEEFHKARLIRVWMPAIAHEGVIKRLILYGTFALSALMALPFCRGTKATWAMSPNYLCMVPATAVKLTTRSRIIHDVVDIWPQALIATGYSFPRSVVKAVNLLSRISYILSDAIVTISDSMRSSLRTVSPKSIRVEVLANCVTNDFFSVPAKTRGRLFHIMYVGTLGPSNDFSTVLEAAKKLQDEEDLKFTIAGSGELASKISQTVRNSNIRNVDLKGQPIKHDNVPLWLGKADALVLPLRKGFGNASLPSKLGEYLATGRPVVCSSDGALASTLGSNNLSLVVAPGDVGELVHAFLRLRKDPGLSHQIGSNGRAYAHEHFSFESFQEKVENLTESIVGTA